MSLVAVAAGKGSRGVTTAALALAAVWPQQRRVLLAECDPAGGSLGVRFGLRPVPGLLTLASVGRRSLDPQELWSHVQPLPGGGLEALLAPVRAEQLLALGRLWADLPAAIARLDGGDAAARRRRGGAGLHPDSRRGAAAAGPHRDAGRAGRAPGGATGRRAALQRRRDRQPAGGRQPGGGRRGARRRPARRAHARRRARPAPLLRPLAAGPLGPRGGAPPGGAPGAPSPRRGQPGRPPVSSSGPSRTRSGTRT